MSGSDNGGNGTCLNLKAWQRRAHLCMAAAGFRPEGCTCESPRPQPANRVVTGAGATPLAGSALHQLPYGAGEEPVPMGLGEYVDGGHTEPIDLQGFDLADNAIAHATEDLVPDFDLCGLDLGHVVDGAVRGGSPRTDDLAGLHDGPLARGPGHHNRDTTIIARVSSPSGDDDYDHGFEDGWRAAHDQMSVALKVEQVLWAGDHPGRDGS